MCRLLKISLRLAITALLIHSVVGCRTSSTATVPTAPPVVAPGYQTPADQQMGQILEAARSFYNELQQEEAAGTFHPSDQEKAALNSFRVTLNAALAEYQSFHQGTATQAQAQAAVDQLKAAQIKLQTTLQPSLNPTASTT